jgi:predicted nucleic acid-binding protein
LSAYVLDASVAISALRAGDANHVRSASYLAPLLQGIDSVVVPTIFDVEVVATLARAGYSCRCPASG